jgi:hypothetical protein
MRCLRVVADEECTAERERERERDRGEVAGQLMVASSGQANAVCKNVTQHCNQLSSGDMEPERFESYYLRAEQRTYYSYSAVQRDHGQQASKRSDSCSVYKALLLMTRARFSPLCPSPGCRLPFSRPSLGAPRSHC